MKFSRLAAAAAGTLALATVSLAFASHSWNGYHWARTTSSFTLQVIDSNTSNWDDELARALSQWSQSSKLDMTVTSYDDSAATRSRCSMVLGKVRSCNYSYGQNGWLGLASINLDSSGHINQGSSKMNDSYSSSFASQNERWHVMCQELGHTIGLGHTSEDGSTQNTCMDYSQSSTSTAPNSHDYNMLASIYGHADNHRSNAFAATMAAATASPAAASDARLSPAQKAMVGNIPLGSRIRKGVFSDTYAAPDGRGGLYVTEVFLAPGFEHTDMAGTQ